MEALKSSDPSWRLVRLDGFSSALVAHVRPPMPRQSPMGDRLQCHLTL